MSVNPWKYSRLYARGVMSEVSALGGILSNPWYASAIARWTASISVSGWSHNAATDFISDQFSVAKEGSSTHSFKLAAHQQYTGPHASLRSRLVGWSIKVPLPISKQNLCQAPQASILLFVQLNHNENKPSCNRIGILTIANWNHNQSSVVVVTCATLLLPGSILPISLNNASLKGSTVDECNIWAL